MKRFIFIILLLLSTVSCKSLKKTETSAVVGAFSASPISWVYRIVPGSRTRRIALLEFKVEEAQLQLRRQELYYEMKEVRSKYKPKHSRGE